MKAVKLFVLATGALIVGVILVLLVLGRRPGAGRVNGVVEIAAPPAVVMPWLVEAPRLRRWVGWLSQVKGDTSGAAVGRRQEWVMDDSVSAAVSLHTELLAYAPPDSMRLELKVPGMVEGVNRYVLEDLGGRTRLTVTGRWRHPNPVIALLEPLATPEAAAKLAKDLARLRAAVEAAAAADSTAPADSAAAAPRAPAKESRP